MIEIRITQDVQIDTPAGAVTFSEGEVLRVDGAEGLPLVEQGYAVPVYDEAEIREISKLRPEERAEIHKVKTLFEGNVLEVIKNKLTDTNTAQQAELETYGQVEQTYLRFKF